MSHTHTTKHLTLSKAKRSQSALEYMMTYGWAILIIVIVAVILYSMGIFNPGSGITKSSSGFSPFAASAAICNEFGVMLSFTVGGLPDGATSATLTSMTLTSASGMNTSTTTTSKFSTTTVASGSTFTILFTGIHCSTSGAAFTASGNLTYSVETPAGAATFSSTGTVAGVSSSASFVDFKREPPTTTYTDYHGGFVSINNNSLFDFTNGFTIAAWVNDSTYDLSGQGCDDLGIVSKDNNIAESYLMDLGTSCSVAGDFNMRSFIINASGEQWVGRGNVVNPSFFYDKWVFMVFTYNPAANNESLYINGKLNSSRTVLGTLVNNNAPLVIGTRGVYYSNGVPVAGWRNFNGSIANVQLYNDSLSPTQVYNLYTSGLYGHPISFSNLVGWWPLYGNLLDYSGHGNNGRFIDMS